MLLTGEGRAFCAGYDIGALTQRGLRRQRRRTLPGGARGRRQAYPYPVVAALNGYAIGGGLELAITCDLRIAAAGVQLGMPPAKLGVVYNHSGINRFVTAIGAGPHRASCSSPAGDSTPRRPSGWGLVNEVVPGEALERASVELAPSRSPPTRRCRCAATRPRSPPTALPPGALDDQTATVLDAARREAFLSEDLREGLAAFAERPPQWRGRWAVAGSRGLRTGRGVLRGSVLCAGASAPSAAAPRRGAR